MQESQLLYLLMTLSLGQSAGLAQPPHSPQMTHSQPARETPSQPSAIPTTPLILHKASTEILAASQPGLPGKK